MQGIVIIKPEAPFGLKITPDQWLYLFTLAILVVMFVLGWNLLRGRVGRALVAIRDHPVAAEAMGVHSALYKTLAFGVSALFTGVAGALGAIVVQFVAPDSFTAGLSINFLVGIVIGGVASISGAFYGALFIQFVPNFADQISKAAPWAIYGVFLLAFRLSDAGRRGGLCAACLDADCGACGESKNPQLRQMNHRPEEDDMKKSIVVGAGIGSGDGVRARRSGAEKVWIRGQPIPRSSSGRPCPTAARPQPMARSARPKWPTSR